MVIAGLIGQGEGGLREMRFNKRFVRSYVLNAIDSIIHLAGFVRMIASDNGVDRQAAIEDPDLPRRVKRLNELAAVYPERLAKQLLRRDPSFSLEPLSVEPGADGYSERDRVKMEEKNHKKYLVGLITRAVWDRLSGSPDGTTRDLIDANMTALLKSFCESVSPGAQHPVRLEEIWARREETKAEIKRKSRVHARKMTGNE